MGTADGLTPSRDPLGRALPCDFTADLAPLGIKLSFGTNNPELLDVCRDSLGRYCDTTYGQREPRFVVRLLTDPEFAEAPPWPAPVFRSLGSLFYVSTGRQNVAVADLRHRSAFGFLSPDMARDREFVRRNFLECLVFTMATHGAGATHTYVHASAVACGGRGLIFSGPPESGKSTLAYACARRGMDVVTDDVAYLRCTEDGLVAWGRPWRLRFLADCPRFFPELGRVARSSQTAENDEVEIEVEAFLPGRTRVCCEPAGLFFLKRAAGPPSCEALGAARAFELLARDLIYDAPEVVEMHGAAWSELARKGSYVLRYGDDLDSAVDLLERFF